MLKPIRPIIPLLFSALFMVAGIGLGNLLVPLRAHAEGWSASTIGMIGTAYALSFTIGCIFAPRLVKRIGPLKTFTLLLCMLGGSLVLIGYFVHPWAWAVFRGLTGIGAAGVYSVIEGWLNEKTSNDDRGLVFSWYMLACLVGLICGQYALPLSSPLMPTLFLLGAACFWLAILPVYLSKIEPPALPTTVKIDFAGVYKNSPAAVIGNVVSGILFATWISFAVLYLDVNGYSSSGIATMMMCGTIGGMVLQFPLGRLSDRIDRRWVMAIIGGGGLVLALVTAAWMPVAPSALVILYFFFGATLHPSYSVNVSHANDHAKAGSHVSLSSTMLVIYGLGTISGPFVAGFAIDAFGFRALFLWLALGYLVYLVFPLWRMTKRAAPDKDTIETAVKPVAAQLP
jgi:MFS family permease